MREQLFLVEFHGDIPEMIRDVKYGMCKNGLEGRNWIVVIKRLGYAMTKLQLVFQVENLVDTEWFPKIFEALIYVVKPLHIVDCDLDRAHWTLCHF